MQDAYRSTTNATSGLEDRDISHRNSSSLETGNLESIVYSLADLVEATLPFWVSSFLLLKMRVW